MNKNIPQAAVRFLKSSKTMTPRTNSSVESMIPAGKERGVRKLTPKALKYSAKTKADPTGSTAFTNPEKTKSNPRSKRANFLMEETFLFG